MKIFADEVGGDDGIRMPAALFLSQAKSYVDRVYRTDEDDYEFELDRIVDAKLNAAESEFETQNAELPYRERRQKYDGEFLPSWKLIKEKLCQDFRVRARKRLEGQLEKEFLDYDLNWKDLDCSDDNMLTADDIDK